MVGVDKQQINRLPAQRGLRALHHLGTVGVTAQQAKSLARPHHAAKQHSLPQRISAAIEPRGQIDADDPSIGLCHAG